MFSTLTALPKHPLLTRQCVVRPACASADAATLSSCMGQAELGFNREATGKTFRDTFPKERLWSDGAKQSE
jgi:hypothetical protein